LKIKIFDSNIFFYFNWYVEVKGISIYKFIKKGKFLEKLKRLFDCLKKMQLSLTKPKMIE